MPEMLGREHVTIRLVQVRDGEAAFLISLFAADGLLVTAASFDSYEDAIQAAEAFEIPVID